MKMSSFLWWTTLLAVLVLVLSLDEDFGFDVHDEFESEVGSESRKGWNNKEIPAFIGKAFYLVVPNEALGKNVRSYEAKQLNDKPLPSWLLFDKVSGTFWGVPLAEDAAVLHLVIRTVGGSDKIHPEEITINVTETRDSDKCQSTEDNTVLTILIDKGVNAIKPKQRVLAINNVAKFFGLPFSAFTIKPQLERDDITDSSVVLAGPGNLHSRSSKLTSLLQVPVGCDGRLWIQTAPLVHQLKQQARDGTITEVIGLPLIGWRVKTETRPVLRNKRQVVDDGSGDYDDYYDDNYDEEQYEDEDLASTSTTIIPSPTHPHRHHHGQDLSPEDSDFSVPVIREHQQNSSPTLEEATTIPMIPITEPSTTTTTTTITTTTNTTTTTTTEKPIIREEIEVVVPSNPSATKLTTHTEGSNKKPDDYYEYEDYGEGDDDEDGPIESKTIVPDLSMPKQSTETVQSEPMLTTTLKSTTTTKEIVIETLPTTTIPETTPQIVEDLIPTTVLYTEESDTAAPTTQTSATVAQTDSTTSTSTTSTSTTSTTESTTTTTTATPLPLPTTTLENTTEEEEEEEGETTTLRLTTARHVTSTPRTTTIREITEGFEFEAKNFAPYIENRLQHTSVIAGKIFRLQVPKHTFKDFEDGYNLTLEFLNSKGEPLAADSWCHFNPTRREIYGLPLEEDVSKWEYVLKATDREGASVADRLTIQVQQHKSQRVVNHEFSLYMRIEKHQEFPHFVDWCLKTLRALGRIYGTNMSEITVRNVNYTSEPVVFTWTNDSIPTNHCPAGEIDKLYKLLTANDRGDPSRELNLLLAPELRVKKVTKHGLGVCETPQVPITPPTNFPPFLRNPVDHINATVGELLVFKVPDDTFYDPEDTDSRSLNISLLTADRQPIKPSNWLQFDSKNREFYGIPRKSGRSEYQLVCVDSAGLPATDSLEIVVYQAPKVHYNVEFSMTLETPYDAFVNSASLQKKFVEKLQEIFDDRNASYIHLNPFRGKDDTTIATWYNKSLSTAKCSHDEISRLEFVLKNNDRSISSRVHSIMEPEFPVSTIKILPISNCRVVKPIHPLPSPEEPIVPVDEKSPEAKSDEFQYLMTFIVPAIIISAMLLLAAIAAIVLYRRRRIGKMNLEEDGRPNYGNKGIPVIFQEELEEKPESGTKAPVILKDEKPPLAPPEYSKSGSLKLNDDSEPYQPPPPFTRTQDNGRQPRPKPTPTYRKPPPYVPP